MRGSTVTEAGRRVVLEITGLTHEGEGVGREGDRAVFVPGAIPGDIVQATVVQDRKNYSRAILDSVKEPSPLRVEPRCPVFEDCGGCSLQNMSYEGQLEWKRRLVEDALKRIGHLEGVTVNVTLPSEQRWHYRNKAMFPVGLGPAGNIIAGCYRKGTHRIVHASDCAIQHPTNNLILREALRLVEEYDIPPYDECSGGGTLRHIMARVAVGTGESMAVFVTRSRRLPHAGRLAAELVRKVPGLVSVIQNVNPEKTNIVLGEEWRVVLGRGHIDDVLGNDRIGRLAFRISPLSFYQVNPIQAARIYEKALEYAELEGSETALDLYCGVGTITLFMAGRVEMAYGIEEVPEAVRDAYRNARLNGIRNVRFIKGKAEWVLPSFAGANPRPRAVILDPPRAGCDPGVLQVICRLRPKTLVYVSCYPSTLARDLRVLVQCGYRVAEVQPADMFPQTPHVECIAAIQRIQG